MNNFELYLLRENLIKIQHKEMTPQLSYAVCENIEVLNRSLRAFDIERERIVKKYSNKEADGTSKIISRDGAQWFDIPEERLETYTKDLEKIFAIENKVDFHKVDLNEVLKQGCLMTPAEIATLKTIAEYKKEPKTAPKKGKNKK